MTRYLLLATRFLLLLLVIFSMASLVASEGVDPAEQFLLAYQNFQQAERLQREGDRREAIDKYHFAENILIDLANNHPDWQKSVVEYRIQKIRDDLARIGESASAANSAGNSTHRSSVDNDSINSGSDRGGSSSDHVQSTDDGDFSTAIPPEAMPPKESRGLELSSRVSESRNTSADNKGSDIPSLSIIPPAGKRGPSDKDLAQLQKQLKKTELELQKARGEIADKVMELDGNKVLVVDMKSQLENAQRQVIDLKSDLAKINSGSTQREASLKKSLQALEGKVSALSADQEVVAEANNQLQQNLKQATASLAAGLGNKNRLEKLQLEMNAEKNASAALHEKLIAAEQERDAANNQNSELQKELKEANGSLLTAEKQTQEITSLRNQVTKLQGEDAGKNKLLAEAQNQAKLLEDIQKNLTSNFEQKLAAVQADQEVMTEQKNALEEKLKQANAQVSISQKVTADAAALREQMTAMAQELKDKDKKLSDSEGARVALEKTEKQLSADIENKLQLAASDRQALDEKKTALEKQLAEMTEKMKSSTQTESTNETEAKSIESLRSQVAKLEEEDARKSKLLAETQHQAKLLEDAQKNLTADFEKKITITQADQEVGSEEKKTLEMKLQKAADEIEVLQKIGADAASLREQVTTANQELERANKQLADAQATQGQLEQSKKQQLADLENKLQSAVNDRQSLEAKKTELEKQLAEMNQKVVALTQAGTSEETVKAEITRYQLELKQGAERLAEAQKKIDVLEKAQPEKDQLLQKQEKDLADARQEADKLQKELLVANQKLSGLQDEVHAKDDHYNQLKKELDQKNEEIEALKKSNNHRPHEEKVVAENELLKGIVLRELKAEAKRQQTKKLITEDLEKLKINSETLSSELKKLARPVKLTPEEKGLFKDQITSLALPDMEEENDDKLMVSVAVSKKDHGVIDHANPAQAITTNTASLATNSPSITNAVAATNEVTNASTNAPTNAIANDQSKAAANEQAHYQEILAKAKDQFEHQNYSDAEKNFQDALAIASDDYLTLSNLGVVEFQLGKMSEAERTLKKAVALDHKKSFALTTLGIVHYRQERLDDAEKALRQALAVNDQDFTAHNYLGIVLAASGKSKAGESEIMKALEINPQYADAHFNLAVIYATGKPPSKELAKTHYTKARTLGAPPDASLEKLLN